MLGTSTLLEISAVSHRHVFFLPCHQAAQVGDSGCSGRLKQRWGVGLQAGAPELTVLWLEVSRATTKAVIKDEELKGVYLRIRILKCGGQHVGIPVCTFLHLTLSK